jgi:hypothetical protein
VRVPSHLDQVNLVDPSGKESQLEARDGVAIIPQPNLPGFYLVSYAGDHPGVALSVVNLTSSSESDLLNSAPAAARGAGANGLTTRSAVTEPPADWGFLAAALALAAVVAQVLWLTRSPGRVESGRIKPLRPQRQGGA